MDFNQKKNKREIVSPFCSSQPKMTVNQYQNTTEKPIVTVVEIG